MSKFDLHMHSCYSQDGQLTPEELVKMAFGKHLKTIALSDHDEICGIPEMIQAAKPLGIQVIPAIECSTLLEGYDVHLLGYGIDLEDPYFKNLSKYTRKLSNDAFGVRVEKLKKAYGVEIDVEDILARSKGKNPWFLMMNRLFQDPRYQDIPDFKDYVPGGKRSDPAPVNFYWDKCQKGSQLFVAVEYPDFFQTVEKIHQAGGLAVVAHPFRTFYQNEKMLDLLLEAGVDGIEAYSNYHEPKHTQFYCEFAKKHDLFITCGSDFHGEKKPSIEMGEYGLKEDGNEILSRFLNALEG